jgi:hypothetical protein
MLYTVLKIQKKKPNYFSSWLVKKGIEKVKVHGPFKYLKNNDLDAYVLAPQCPENEYWDLKYCTN